MSDLNICKKNNNNCWRIHFNTENNGQKTFTEIVIIQSTKRCMYPPSTSITNCWLIFFHAKKYSKIYRFSALVEHFDWQSHQTLPQISITNLLPTVDSHVLASLEVIYIVLIISFSCHIMGGLRMKKTK